MITERLTALMGSLTNQTVLGELLAPVTHALRQVRGSNARPRVLSIADFIALWGGLMPTDTLTWPNGNGHLS